MKPAPMIASLLLMIIAIGQLVRALAGWTLTINGFSVPVWVSFAAAAVAGIVGVKAFLEARRV